MAGPPRLKGAGGPDGRSEWSEQEGEATPVRAGVCSCRVLREFAILHSAPSIVRVISMRFFRSDRPRGVVAPAHLVPLGVSLAMDEPRSSWWWLLEP